jgi:hypothetical protein
MSTTGTAHAKVQPFPARQDLQEQTRRRAYEIYLRRGATPGDALQDWLEAESEVLGRLSSPPRRAGTKIKTTRKTKQK